MATVFDEDHEGGVDGALVTTSNTSYTSIQGEPTFTASEAIGGTLGMRCSAPIAPCGGTVDFTATTKRAFRVYYTLKDWPTGSEILPLMRVRVGGSTTVADLRVNTAGQIVLRNGTGIQDTSSTSATVDDPFGVDLFINGSSMQCRLYMTPGSGTLTETLSGTPTAGSFSRFVVGALDVGYSGTVIVDDVKHDDSGFVGPATAAAASAGLKKYAVRGGALVELTAYRVGPSGTLI